MKQTPHDFIRREVALAKGLVDLNQKHDAFLKKAQTIESLVKEHKNEVSRVLKLPKGDKGDRGEIGPRGLTGKDGKNGKDGVDGITPVKGKDYFTKADKEDLTISVLARIRTPKDGEDAIVDKEEIANDVISLIKEKQLLTTDSISGLRNELTSYRSQLAMKQAGQHGGGDTVVAGTGITITTNANGTKTIAATGGGTGTVTDVSIVSANGFAGSVATSTTTPAITLTTTVTGLLKGNGTAISAAVANTDYQVPIVLTTTGSSGAATFDGTTLNIPQYTAGGGGQVNTVVGTADRITVNSTDPVNPVVDIASTYVGQTSITTLGTIATGTWNATAIAVNKIVAITANRAVVSDASGFISAATTTSTEIGYVNGVTSSIQTQLNGKQATISFGTGVETALGVNVGTAGSIVVNGGALGTPSSGTVTNLTGTASININGTVGATTPTTATFTTATINTGIVPDANDGAYLGQSGTAFSDLFLADGAVINWNAGNISLTHSAGVLTISDQNPGATGPTLEIYQDSVSPAAADVVGTLAFYGEDSAGNKQLYGKIAGTILSPTSGAETSYLDFSAYTITTASTLRLNTTSLIPLTSDGLALGTTANQWSDLFLAEGGVINWDNGDATLTQTGNVLALAGADLRVATADVGTNADSVPTLSSTNTLTNKRITKRVGSTTSSATPTINTDNVDAYHLTAQTADITSFTTNLSGTPTDFQQLRISVTGTAARAITWGSSFANGPVALPTTTVTTTRLDVLFEYDTVTSKWRCMASGSTV